ncbi:hypothetical protein EOD00_25915 [Mesorhizobium sp. M7A.T.Ca.TU.009.01.3.1]|nr:hypothetical protein EOD00_25915 [Mesorhizobium sp. M7A.T.Ca.TU.009.01.3.1]
MDGTPCRLAANAHRFVIHGRSKERSDAAQTRGSMPRLQIAAAGRNCAPLRPWLRSRHGSSGLRDGASLLLRPRMTKLGEAPANPECQRWSTEGRHLAADRSPTLPDPLFQRG